MRKLDQIRLRIRSLLHRRDVDRELEDEVRFHLDQLVEENVAAGMAQEEARWKALRSMGGVTKFQEECRDMRKVNLVEDFSRDMLYACRSLRRSPGFAALAVSIMALGIGANTAVFSVVNAVLLRPLAYRDPDRIVTLSSASITAEGSASLIRQVSIPNFRDWHDQSSSFQAMAYYTSRETAVVIGSTAEYAQVTRVSPEFFPVLGIQPSVGRFFTTEEWKQGGGGALMVSYAYWQSHFGGSPRVLGQTIRVFGGAIPIAGVLPAGFGFPGNTDLWFPANTTFREPTAEYRGAQNYLAVGRLKDGVAIERAQTEMKAIAGRLEQQYPKSNKGWTVSITTMRDELVGDIRLTLYLLFGAVTLVLLIACANTATLLLGKATARTREVAVRTALGASPSRIVRQVITESLLLAVFAGASGLALAYWGSKVLVVLAPAKLPRLEETGLDAWVLAFALAVSIGTSLLFGLAPAVYASRVDLNDVLKQGGARSVLGGGMLRMRAGLVVAEIALAVVLLSGAGLLMKSFDTLQNVPLGFRPENVLLMKATAPRAKANQFFKDVLSQTAMLPGVRAAGATMIPPGRVDATGGYYVDNLPAEPNWPFAPGVVLSVFTPGAFAALGIPLTRGRDFSDSDTSDKPFVAIVNEALVRRSFSGKNPIGRTIFCSFDSLKGMTIVGVAGDVRQRGAASDPMPECYMPYQQHGSNGSTLSVVVRTVGNPTALAETVRRVAAERSPDVPVRFTTMEAALSEGVVVPRFRTALFGLFAGLAVCLAMAGVYGVMAYAVSQRSSEIGLRMALGASKGSVLRFVLKRAMALSAIGLALGLVISMAATRLISSMLFQVQPNDPVVYCGVVALLGLVTFVACYAPARRAANIDPLAAIRRE